MKKLLFISLMLFLFANAYEEVPILNDTNFLDIQIEKDNNELIQIQNMKKANSVEKAKNDKINSQKPRIKLNARQIQHQKALDYMYNRGYGTMLPIF